MLTSRFVLTPLLSVPLVAALLSASDAEAAVLRLTGRIGAVDGAALSGQLEVISGQGHIRAKSFPTDSQGQFSIEVEASSRLFVVARADGHVSVEREIAPSADGQELRLDFTLFPSGTVSGRVVDESGRPVTGAVVRLHYPGEVRRVVYEQEAGNVRSDDFGYFTLPFVAQGRAFVVEAASQPRLPAFSAPLTLPGRAMEGVVVALEHIGQPVRVTVVGSGGAPISEVIVRLQAFADGESYTAEQRKTRTFFGAANRLTRTGADGLVEFQGVPAGRVAVVASRPGKKPVRQESLLVRGQAIELTITAP